MAKNIHNITIHQNSGLEGVSYLGNYVSRGKYDFGAFAEYIERYNSSITADEVALVLDSLFELAKWWSEEATWSGKAAGISFRPTISGSFDKLDSEWNDNLHAMNMIAVLDTDISGCIADCEPAIVSDSSKVLVKIDRVLNTDPEAKDSIMGGGEFKIFGTNLYFDLDDEIAYFEAGGVRYPATLVQSEGPQRAKFRLDEARPAKSCDGKFYVFSHGKDGAEAPIQTAMRSVQYVEMATLPVISGLANDDCTADMPIDASTGTILGRNLVSNATYVVEYTEQYEPSESSEWKTDGLTATVEFDKLNKAKLTLSVAPSALNAKGLRIKVTTAAGTASYIHDWGLEPVRPTFTGIWDDTGTEAF